MELEQQLLNIEQLMPTLATFQRSRQANITPDQQELLKSTYQSIFGIIPSVSCSPCTIEALHNLTAYWEKHTGKSSVIPPVPENKSRKKPCDGCKQKY
ncbi:MAG: hypothetical protein EOO46_01325 [Flavobacterium sp.]|nr:MAG: hypothetical protein EOO46_01325 [Flavobacterium sp.]